MPTITELFNLAVLHHESGRLQQAEALYRQVVEAEPTHAGAHHRLGLLAHQAGHPKVAIALLSQATLLGPADPDCYFSLGVVLMGQGETARAIECYRRVLSI